MPDLRSNFDEINRLVTEKSKVVILGRPTIFLSERERSYAIRGSTTLGRVPLQRAGSRTYEELHLSSFTPEQVGEFISKYLKFCGKDEEFITKRQNEIRDKGKESLVSRPVHAKMLVEIGSDQNIDISSISRFDLYSHFLDHLIQRELVKPGRGKLYKSNDRRGFSADLAWHLWANPAPVYGCRMDDLPDGLFEPYRPSGQDVEAVKRDLISSSFLDEKAGGIYYFPHRSIQEFLVAEYIWNAMSGEAPDGTESIEKICHFLTKEVYDFLIERDDVEFFRMFVASIRKLKRGLPVEFFNVVSESRKLYDVSFERSSAVFSAWDAAILISHLLSDAGGLSEIRSVVNLIRERSDRKPAVALLSAYLLVVFGDYYRYNLMALAPFVISLLFYKAESDIESLAAEGTNRGRGDQLRDVLFACVTAQNAGDGSLEMTIDLTELCDQVDSSNLLVPVSDWAPVSGGAYEAKFEMFFSEVDVSLHKLLRGFYERDALAQAGLTESRSTEV